MSANYINEQNYFFTDNFDYGAMYDDLGHERGILFVDKKYYIVFDLLKPTSSTTSIYEWLIHGNGSINKGTAKQYNGGAEWFYPQENVGLFAYVLPQTGDVISLKEGINSESYGTSTKHTYMSVLRKERDAGFVSLLYPSPDRIYPEISKMTYQGIDVLKLQKDDWKAFSFVNKKNIPVNVLISEDQLNIYTDASKFFVKFENGNKYIFADSVTTIFIDGKSILKSENPTTVSIIFEGNNVKISYMDNGEVYFYGNVNNIMYNDKQRNDLYNGEFVNL